MMGDQVTSDIGTTGIKDTEATATITSSSSSSSSSSSAVLRTTAKSTTRNTTTTTNTSDMPPPAPSPADTTTTKSGSGESLMQKWKDHYQNEPAGFKATRFSVVLFHFHTTTQLYMTLTYIVPSLMEDYSPMTRYYAKIFFCYLYAMCEANWFCSVFYTSDLPDVRDRPTLDTEDWFQKPPDTMKNAEDIQPKVDRWGFEWKYCRPCNRYRPPRSHHCDVCAKCVLRRDHHCYFIGRCIGHYNQRYFVVLCGYGIMAAIICLPVTMTYVFSLPDATWWGDYFLPYTFFLWLYQRSVSWQFTLLLYHAYVWAMLFLASGFYFTVQSSLILAGKTLVELAKQFDMKVTSNWREHVRMVFGDYWLCNFVFPAQLIFKQRHDGVHYENVKFFYRKDGDE